MISILLLFLVIQWNLSDAYQVTEKETLSPKLPLRPGDLLRSLDALTSDAQVIYSPLQETSKNQAERRVYHNEALNDNEETASEYDYDKAYENFVKKYFAKGEEDSNSEDESDNEDEKAGDVDDDVEASPFELSSEVHDDSKVKENSSSGSKKCERIQINDQNCKVCEDPKTNEKSKTCSYSSDNKPKSYAYSNKKSRKHFRGGDDTDDVDDDGSDETGRSLKRETSSYNKRKFQPRRTSIEPFLKQSPPDDNSKCTRKLENDMICFYCGSVSENTRECFADKNNSKKRHDEFSKKDSATKKIFKRMVSYSFRNDAKPKLKKNTYAAYTGYSN